jgi:hypothetical protein
MAGMGIDRNVSHARFSLRRYTVPQLVFGSIVDYGDKNDLAAMLALMSSTLFLQRVNNLNQER